MTTHSEDLVSLEEIRSVLNTYAGPEDPRERTMRRGRGGVPPVLTAAVVLVALALAAVAAAGGFGAFTGISAAQHPQIAADRLGPSDLPPECNYGSAVAGTSPFCHLVLSSSRLLATVPGGGKLWAVTDTRGDLCVILQHGAASCSSALSSSHPTTITSGKANPETAAITWGITLDDVTAVSFLVGGKDVTVPVKNNVWFYVGDNADLSSMTVHLSDGTTERLVGTQFSRSG